MECELCGEEINEAHWNTKHPDMYLCSWCTREGNRYFVADEDYTDHLTDKHEGGRVHVIRPGNSGFYQVF